PTVFLLRRPPPISTLSAYATLFRSNANTDYRERATQPCTPTNLSRLPTSITASVPSSSTGTSAPARSRCGASGCSSSGSRDTGRSEEHTSELQSRENLVCRLLLDKE